jgi:hypothetical protein
MLERHWEVAGDPTRVEEDHEATYHEDAVLEFPQSGERFRGRERFQGWREKYPLDVQISIRRLRGSGDLWVSENLITYEGGDTWQTVNILELREGKVTREAIYFAKPFEAPEWRAAWAERDPPG